MNKYTQFLLLSNKKIYDGGTKPAFFDRKSAVCPRITVFLFTRRRSDFTRNSKTNDNEAFAFGKREAET